MAISDSNLNASSAVIVISPNERPISFFRRVKNCLMEPKTIIATGASFMLFGGAMITSSAFLPQFSPVLWIAGGLTAGVGCVLGIVGIALNAYQNAKKRHLSRVVNEQALESHSSISNQELKNYRDENAKALSFSPDYFEYQYARFVMKNQQIPTWPCPLFPHLFYRGNHLNSGLIRDAFEAKKFIKSNCTGAKYKKVIKCLVECKDKKLTDFINEEYIIAFWQSLSLFAYVDSDPILQEALKVFFAGNFEPNTLAFLQQP